LTHPLILLEFLLARNEMLHFLQISQSLQALHPSRAFRDPMMVLIFHDNSPLIKDSVNKGRTSGVQPQR